MTTMVTIAELGSGKTGVIRQFSGGRGMVRRLHALGLREGKKVKKISAGVLAGPVIVQVDQSQIAIGRRMAARVLVETTV